MGWGRGGDGSRGRPEKYRVGGKAVHRESTTATHTGLSPRAAHRWTLHRIMLARGSQNIVGIALGTTEKTSCPIAKTRVLGPEINLQLL